MTQYGPFWEGSVSFTATIAVQYWRYWSIWILHADTPKTPFTKEEEKVHFQRPRRKRRILSISHAQGDCQGFCDTKNYEVRWYFWDILVKSIQLMNPQQEEWEQGKFCWVSRWQKMPKKWLHEKSPSNQKSQGLWRKTSKNSTFTLVSASEVTCMKSWSWLWQIQEKRLKAVTCHITGHWHQSATFASTSSSHTHVTGVGHHKLLYQRS